MPNALTIGRVVLAGVFIWMLAVWSYDASPLARGGKEDPWLLLAAALFIGAAATDALDGHLARRWGVVSVFGRVMDPFADKVLVIGAFIMLSGPGFSSRQYPGEPISCVEPWMAVVILARELLVTTIRGVYESRGVSFAATASGKWKMILQCVCVPLVLVLIATKDTRPDVDLDTHGDGFDGATPGARYVIMLAVWATVVVTAWSGVPYVLRAVRERARLGGSKKQAVSGKQKAGRRKREVRTERL